MARKTKDATFIMRMNKDLKAQAKELADSHGLSMAEFINRLLVREIGPARKG